MVRSATAYAVGFLCCFSLIQCGEACAGTLSFKDIKAEIKAQQEKMKAAMLAGNMDELLSLFTDDFRLLPEGAPMLHGKEALKAYLERTLPSLKKLSKVDTVIIDEIIHRHDATLVTTDIFYDKEGKVVKTNRSIEVWQYVRGQWLQKWDSYNSEPKPNQ